MTHHRFLFSELEKKWNNYNKNKIKATNVVNALHQVAEQTHKRSLIVLFSDIMDSANNNEEFFSALQHLKHRNHEVIIFHTIDKSKELDLNYDNSPYTFVDMETGEEVKLNPYQVKKAYKEQFEVNQKQMKLKCGQYHIDYVLADINTGFDAVLLQYLIKRKKMN
jgi:hypothetical protein